MKVTCPICKNESELLRYNIGNYFCYHDKTGFTWISEKADPYSQDFYRIYLSYYHISEYLYSGSYCISYCDDSVTSLYLRNAEKLDLIVSCKSKLFDFKDPNLIDRIKKVISLI